MGTEMSRRGFMKRAASAAVALGPAAGVYARTPASDRVRLGFIGCGGRGIFLMKTFQGFPDVDIVAISDVIEPRMTEASGILSQGTHPHKAESFLDYRRMLDRKDLDAVVIATTQHWHGLPHIHACQASKHVFVEKPLSHTVVEGRAMVEAAKKHGVIAVMGSQQRSGPHYKEAVAAIQSGRLGKIPLVECVDFRSYGKQRAVRVPDSDPPPGYHWDMWLGPAPYVPFNRSRLMANHQWFDYGGGMMTNWGIHHFDIVLWAMHAESPTMAVHTGGKLFYKDDPTDGPDTIEASWEFPGFVMRYCYRGFSEFPTTQRRPSRDVIVFYGSEGTMVLDRHGYEIWSNPTPSPASSPPNSQLVYKAEGDPAKEQDGAYHRLFVDCLKGLEKPSVDIEVSHKATVCCHLANIAYHTKRAIRWDGKTESIIDDPEAARLLTRPRRKGFELPQV